MPLPHHVIILCSCAGRQPRDVERLSRALPDSDIVELRDPAGSDRERLLGLAKSVSGLTIACSCQGPAIEDVLEEAGIDLPVTFANLNEPAAFSDEAAGATPKMAALLALAATPAPPFGLYSMESQGVTVIYGSDDTALEVARRLADDLDLTILLAGGPAVLPPRGADYPVYSGIIRSAKGRLGAFELTVDSFAAPAQGMRGPLRFGPSRNGATSTCDLILDVSGRMPLFAAHELRPGYLRASPGDRAAIERLIAEARDLVGTFDKPRYIAFKPELCAHSRSRITGCTRCIDICPTGAITPQGDSVAIDPGICGGCGGCSALCPTGAASYALPAPDHAVASLRTLLTSYFAAGGEDPIVLVHDRDHGDEMIHLLAHAGAGLPARALPLAVNEVTALGLEAIAAAFAYGATALRVLTRARPRHDDAPLRTTLTLAGTILSGLGFAEDAATVIATDDPDALGAALRTIGRGTATPRRASFLPAGTKRQVQRLALRELRAVAPAQTASIALPAGAPMGRVTVASDGCTLCLACVSACPAEALRSNPERPELKFSEELCVQCGVCAATCPEKVISLEPRLDFDAIDAGPVVLKQEDPHACERCGKLFGTRSTIARIREKLAANHWMFTGAHATRMKLIGLCEDCRVIAATESAIDPYAGAPRPKPRTAEDYRRVAEGIDLDPQAKKDTGV